jgi:hypothetical protein
VTHAQPDAPETEAPETEAVDTEASATEATDAEREEITRRRGRPDYDHRDDEGPDAGEALVWIPRIAFAPITLVLDYVIRRPLGWLATVVEREQWIDAVLDFLTWNERRSGLVPTFFVAYGLQPSVGLVLFSNDDIAPGHSLNASASFGGIDFLEGSASYGIVDRERVHFTLRGVAGMRPDRVFSGIGWDAQAVQYRFRERWYDVDLVMRANLWRESSITLSAGVDGHDFDPDGYAVLAISSPPLSSAIQQGLIEAPYGLDAPYVVARPRVDVAIDSREREPSPGHGVHLDGHAEMALDVNDPLDRRWVRWGASLGGFLDLGAHRVLGLWALARFSDPIGGAPVPFTELVALGQEALLLQGFLRGQLRGRSAAAATLEYLYPIWTRLDARLHVSVGNAFDAHLQDFAFERLRLSFGIGIATAGDPDEAFQITLAAGAAPFVEGSAIQSVQVVFGSRRGL